MAPVSQFRQFCYAVLATLVAFGYFLTYSRGSDGGWVFWWALGSFAALLIVDRAVTTRVLDRGTPA